MWHLRRQSALTGITAPFRHIQFRRMWMAGAYVMSAFRYTRRCSLGHDGDDIIRWVTGRALAAYQASSVGGHCHW